MAFYKELRDYRINVLNINQEEACARLHMTQPALSQYESGVRSIPINAIRLFQEAYAIPPEHLMHMLFEGEHGEEYSPMVLREHANEVDTNRVLELLNKQPELFSFLISLAHSDEKTQSNIIEFLPHLKKLFNYY